MLKVSAVVFLVALLGGIAGAALVDNEWQEYNAKQIETHRATTERIQTELDTVKNRRAEQIQQAVEDDRQVTMREWFWFGLWTYCKNIVTIQQQRDGRAMCLENVKIALPLMSPDEYSRDGWDWDYASGGDGLGSS